MRLHIPTTLLRMERHPESLFLNGSVRPEKLRIEIVGTLKAPNR